MRKRNKWEVFFEFGDSEMKGIIINEESEGGVNRIKIG